MASKYTEVDKARVYVVLTANEGNAKRTARDTNMSLPTVRRWKKEWERNGPPDTSEVGQEVEKFYDEAETVRTEALRELRKKLPTATPSALVAVIGVLDDKIARVKGLDKRQVEHKLTLPSAEEVRSMFRGYLDASQDAARQRDAEIIDAEYEEQAVPALPR